MKHSFKCSDDEDEDSDDSVERYISKADINNSDSTFDYAQLDISETDDILEVKENRSKAQKHKAWRQKPVTSVIK